MSIVIFADHQHLPGYIIINSLVIVDYITKISQDQPGRTDSRSCKVKANISAIAVNLFTNSETAQPIRVRFDHRLRALEATQPSS